MIATLVFTVLLVSANLTPGQSSESKSAAHGRASGAAKGSMSSAGSSRGAAGANAAAGAAANSTGGASMEAAAQLLLKMRGMLCIVPPPAVDEVNEIMNCCPLMQFFVSIDCVFKLH